MSAIRMRCARCGNVYIAGVVGSTPWPAHVCPPYGHQPVTVVRRDDALAALSAVERERDEANERLDRAITDIGVSILALRACDEAGESVPSRLRAHICVMEDEWFNVPTPEGSDRRDALAAAGADTDTTEQTT